MQSLDTLCLRGCRMANNVDISWLWHRRDWNLRRPDSESIVLFFIGSSPGSYISSGPIRNTTSRHYFDFHSEAISSALAGSFNISFTFNINNDSTVTTGPTKLLLDGSNHLVCSPDLHNISNRPTPAVCRHWGNGSFGTIFCCSFWQI